MVERRITAAHQDWQPGADRALGVLLLPGLLRPGKHSVHLHTCLSGDVRWAAAELSHWDAQVAIKDSAPFDPYNILELEKGATDKEVKRAYRQLSLKFHPDKNPDPEANKYFAEYITKAYQALSDPVARDNYEKYGHPDGQQVMHHDVSLCACAGTRLHMRMHLQGILRCMHAY